VKIFTPGWKTFTYQWHLGDRHLLVCGKVIHRMASVCHRDSNY